MNQTTLAVQPGVTTFIEQVRARLADLPPEVRDELTDGLEADLSELVTEHADSSSADDSSRSPEPLGEISVASIVGDPVTYADELRAAAGLPMRTAQRARPSVGERTTSVLDRGRRRWESAMAMPLLSAPWALLVALRPLWWAFRAWVAVQFLDLVAGNEPHRLVPAIAGQFIGSLVLAVAVVVSVQIGRGVWWPGDRRPGSRALLAVLNCGAVLLALPTMTQIPGFGGYDATRFDYVSQVDRGLTNGGIEVCDIQPYSAEGEPLVGVQLFDQQGRPLNTACGSWNDRKRPWMLGDVQRWNVFPLGIQRDGDSVPTLPTPNLDQVPAVRSPLSESEQGSEPGPEPGPELGPGPGVGAPADSSPAESPNPPADRSGPTERSQGE
jgi:hypothetical protein